MQAAQFRFKFPADLRVLFNDVPNLWRSSYEAYCVFFESLALFSIQRLQFLIGEYKIYLCHEDDPLRLGCWLHQERSLFSL